jgi:hypothetical protein
MSGRVPREETMHDAATKTHLRAGLRCGV